jgi:hypothetical protein
LGRTIGGNEINSYGRCFSLEQPVSEKTDLEGLGIPVLDLPYGGHGMEVVWQLVELLYAMGETDREFLCRR